MDRATQDRLERRLAKLEQDARSGRPVNVTSPPQIKSLPLFFPSLSAHPGYSPNPQPIADGAPGNIYIPEFSMLLPGIPSTAQACLDLVGHWPGPPFISAGSFSAFCANLTDEPGSTITLRFLEAHYLGNDTPSLGIGPEITLVKITENRPGTTRLLWRGFSRGEISTGTFFFGYANNSLPKTTAPSKITNQSITATIVSANQTTKTITLSGDQTPHLSVGSTFTVGGSSGNDGTKTCQSTTYTATSNTTTVAINEAVANQSAGGTATIPGSLLYDLEEIFTANLPGMQFGVNQQPQMAFHHQGQWGYFPVLDYYTTFNQSIFRPIRISYGTTPPLMPERLPDALIPKGLLVWEQATPKGTDIRLRIRHPKNDAIYEAILPTSEGSPFAYDKKPGRTYPVGGDAGNYGVVFSFGDETKPLRSFGWALTQLT
jgi:hypothetical protein